MHKISVDMSLDERKSYLVQRCFVDMADMDYVTARWAYANGIFHNFYWSAAQCVEKYFKATLLYSNRSTKGFGHNLNRLYEAVCEIDPTIKDLYISLPDTTAMGRQAWDKKPMSLFVDYLNQYGSPDSRYSLAGTFINGPVIHPFDALCSRARQLMRFRNFISEDLFSWSQTKSGFSDRMDVDRPWMIDGELLLERLYADRYSVGQKAALRDIFRNMNFAFFDERTEGEATFGGQHFTGAPLQNHLFRLRQIDDSEENIFIIDQLRLWADSHIELPKSLRALLHSPSSKGGDQYK